MKSFKSQVAESTPYDNTESGLEARNLQDATDTLALQQLVHAKIVNGVIVEVRECFHSSGLKVKKRMGAVKQ